MEKPLHPMEEVRWVSSVGFADEPLERKSCEQPKNYNPT